MLWRDEQNFYPGKGWGNGLMIREGSRRLIGLNVQS
jgi:hypothetical protein